MHERGIGAVDGIAARPAWRIVEVVGGNKAGKLAPWKGTQHRRLP
jgi:hypothetical protein